MIDFKKFLKINSLVIVINVLFVSFFLSSFNVSAEMNGSILSEDVPESVDFDLTKNEVQEFTFTDEDGNEVTFGVEPVELPEENEGQISTLGTETISMGTSTWKIYHYSGAINMSYYIDIDRTSSNTSITDAYDLSVTLIEYTERNREFWFDSSKAEYTASAALFNSLVSITIWLKASVSGDTLTTSAKS